MEQNSDQCRWGETDRDAAHKQHYCMTVSRRFEENILLRSKEPSSLAQRTTMPDIYTISWIIAAAWDRLLRLLYKMYI